MATLKIKITQKKYYNTTKIKVSATHDVASDIWRHLTEIFPHEMKSPSTADLEFQHFRIFVTDQEKATRFQQGLTQYFFKLNDQLN